MSRADNCPFQDREAAWLRFDQRVLQEAEDPSVPLLERLRFIEIFSRNLDEFFMTRVAKLRRLARIDPPPADPLTGRTPGQRLTALLQAVPALCRERDRVYFRLEKELTALGLRRTGLDAMSSRERRLAARYFRASLAPMLSPVIPERRRPLPHLASGQLCAALTLDVDGSEQLALIPIPNALPGLYSLGGGRYLPTGQLILDWAHLLFEHKVTSRALISVIRGGETLPDADGDGELPAALARAVKRRDIHLPVLLWMEGTLEAWGVSALLRRLRLPSGQVLCSQAPLRLDYADALWTMLRRPPSVMYDTVTPKWPSRLDPSQPVIPQITRRDILLCYPYHSMEPFLRLVWEAARDDAVTSIKLTVYRLGPGSELAGALALAAANGKEVTVLVELRARMDEMNNIHWAKRLEEAGCSLLYGSAAGKVHAKLCLITRREGERFTTLTQIGTGNYNEDTVRRYSDLCLLTAHPGIGADAAKLFFTLSTGLPQTGYRCLLPAPELLRRKLCQLVRREAEKGPEGFIFCKVNMLDDPIVLSELLRACRAGTPVVLNIRCCGRLLPGVPGQTEGLRVFTLVGRFLEHARVYIFGRGAGAAIYLSSADWMTRNLKHRVELACPVLDEEVRRQVAAYAELLCRDTLKSRELCPDGSLRQDRRYLPPLDAQAALMDEPDL